MTDYVDEAARILLAKFGMEQAESKQDVRFAAFEWRGDRYAGSIRCLYPEQPQVAVVNKTGQPLKDEVIERLKEYKPDTLPLLVDSSVDFSGTLVRLQMTGDTLTHLTPEQAQYVSEHPRLLRFI